MHGYLAAEIDEAERVGDSCGDVVTDARPPLRAEAQRLRVADRRGCHRACKTASVGVVSGEHTHVPEYVLPVS